MRRCNNPTCGGNGNCATCPKRMSEKLNNGAFEAVAEYAVSEKEGTVNCDALKAGNEKKNIYAIAIDLGTTTLAFSIVDILSKKILHTVTMLNSQRKYGADVLSRIQASVDGKQEELREAIQKDLSEGIDKLLKGYRTIIVADGLSEQQSMDIDHVVIAGNTTMIHLLMGYDCSTLGVYPFAPVNTEFILGTAEEIIGYKQPRAEIKTTILPSISAFIGGDIVAGLYALDFAANKEISLFVDLGTNGEIALGNCDRILATSVAAGPAFEGGNISCGTGSVAGAICAVEINLNDRNSHNNNSESEKKVLTIQMETIHNAPPCGICGTGVIENVAELLNCGLIDETGLLADEYFDNGFPLTGISIDNTGEQTDESNPIIFTQQDIRQFQLAKAAVRTGIEILTKEYGITTEEIAKVYIAGGFGYHLNVAKAASIGLIPPELADKATSVGNTSLAGAVKYLNDMNASDTIQRIKNASEDIILANDTDFQELYLKNTCLG